MSTSTVNSTPDLSDYDSSSSIEFVVCAKKLKAELEKELEEERKEAAETGAPTYEDGTKQKLDTDGRVRNPEVVREERVLKKHRMMKAECAKHVAKHLKRPHVRSAYEFFSRDVPPEHDLGSDLTRKKIRVQADEDRMSVTIVRLPPLPYGN